MRMAAKSAIAPPDRARMRRRGVVTANELYRPRLHSPHVEPAVISAPHFFSVARLTRQTYVARLLGDLLFLPTSREL